MTRLCNLFTTAFPVQGEPTNQRMPESEDEQSRSRSCSPSWTCDECLAKEREEEASRQRAAAEERKWRKGRDAKSGRDWDGAGMGVVADAVEGLASEVKTVGESDQGLGQGVAAKMGEDRASREPEAGKNDV